MFREELKGNVSIVRELHVYGSAIPVHSRSTSQFQHKGYGTLLMEEAERIAREEHFSDKIAVISGVGTRHYYRKLGYSLDGVYMSKMLNWIVCLETGGWVEAVVWVFELNRGKLADAIFSHSLFSFHTKARVLVFLMD